MRWKAVDLFCGAGGLSLGFLNCGFELAFAADNDPDAIETYRRNLGDHVRLMDLSGKEPRDLAKEIRIATNGVDVLIGGPPCQGFSVQRRGSAFDSRNSLLRHHIRIGMELDVKVIVVENVPAILGSRGQGELTQVVSDLNKGGYSLHTRVLQAADYGVPQLRRRAFIVAIREDVSEVFHFPLPDVVPDEYRTVGQALTGLPEPPESFVVHPNFGNHQRRKSSPRNLERLSYVPEGGGRLDIPENLRLTCHKKDNGHRHLDVYGRMWRDRPSPTITAMFDNFTRGRFAHPVETRNITNREGARLQAFPDHFEFFGDLKSVARQIGNAVPPLLAQAMAEAIATTLSSANNGATFLQHSR